MIAKLLYMLEDKRDSHLSFVVTCHNLICAQLSVTYSVVKQERGLE